MLRVSSKTCYIVADILRGAHPGHTHIYPLCMLRVKCSAQCPTYTKLSYIHAMFTIVEEAMRNISLREHLCWPCCMGRQIEVTTAPSGKSYPCVRHADASQRLSLLCAGRADRIC